MPTQIDVALAAAKQEIASIHNSVTNVDEDLSPLFRDEVQRHEMSYLDSFLSPETKANEMTSNFRRDGSKESHSVGVNHGLIYESSELSRIAQLMGPNNYYDSPAAEASNDSNSLCNRRRDEGDSSDGSQKFNAATQMNTPNAQPQTYTAARQFTHRSPNNQHNKHKLKRPTPSMSKRRQLKHRFMQNAKQKSRQVATNMVRFANRCTRNMSSFSDIIRGSVHSAIKRIHILLEETQQHAAVGVRNGNENIDRGSLLKQSAVNVPPMKSFAFAPKWASAEFIKQQAESFVESARLSSKNEINQEGLEEESITKGNCHSFIRY